MFKCDQQRIDLKLFYAFLAVASSFFLKGKVRVRLVQYSSLGFKDEMVKAHILLH